MIRVYYNTYQDQDEKRNDELRVCEAMNKENPLTYFTPYEGRPTVKELIEYINETANIGDIAVIINSDCHIDDTIIHLTDLQADEAYALSRWDIQDKGAPVLFDREDSQDAWAVKVPIANIEDCDFTLGTPGVDNAFAERLQRAGYKVTNPSKTIKVYHLHLSGVRRHNWRNPCSKPYLYVKPTTL